MTTLDIVTYEEEIGQLEGSVRRLRQDANAKAVLLFDRDGRPVVEAGDTGSVDTTPPAVLTGGSGDGGADLIDKREQSVLIHEGQGDTRPPRDRRAVGGPGRPEFEDRERGHGLRAGQRR